MKINEFFQETGMMKNFFCSKVGISPTTLSALLKRDYEPQLRIAIAIEEFTKGKVSCRDWLSLEDHKTKKTKKRKSSPNKNDKTPTE
jgi:DNA-binding XRE family transcriptional regulator